MPEVITRSTKSRIYRLRVLYDGSPNSQANVVLVFGCGLGMIVAGSICVVLTPSSPVPLTVVIGHLNEMVLPGVLNGRYPLGTDQAIELPEFETPHTT